MKSGEQQLVTLTAYNDKPEVREEIFYVHAIIENMEKKKIIMETTIKAEFVKPLIKFSHKNMYFRTDSGVCETAAFVRGNYLFKIKKKIFSFKYC